MEGEGGDKTELNFNYILSHRRSYQISLNRSGDILVRAPLSTSYEQIQDMVKHKSRWIKNKLDVFSQYNPPPAPEYIKGALHFYLGKEYQLQLILPTHSENLRRKAKARLVDDLAGGLLEITASSLDESYIERVMMAWYRQRATIVYQTLLDECWHLFSDWDYTKPPIRIRKMKSRWGSMSSQGKMSLNVELIKYPPDLIIYVIIHELCHLKHMNHGKNFYKALNRRLPNWKVLKNKLEETKLNTSRDKTATTSPF